MLQLGFHFWVNTKKHKWDRLQEKANELKEEQPEKAIKLLKKTEKVMKRADFKPVSLLGVRLQIAVILYEHGRTEEAETMLLAEYSRAKKWKIGRKEEREAKRQRELYKMEKYPGNFPDWERNLYCKAIYGRLRSFYEQTKQYEKAVPWALAEVYAHYENQLQVSWKDNISPDFKPVLRCLKKCKREAEMPDLEKIFWEYAKNPDCSMCWRMIDEQFTQ